MEFSSSVCDVVEFVKEIEKYPCIYDTTIPDYKNRVITKRAWDLVAAAVISPAPECKERWRRIRISYLRALTEERDKPERKPYHLAEELEFLRPFMRLKDKSLHQKDESNTIESPTHNEEYLDTYDEATEVEYLEEQDVSDISLNNSHSLKRKRTEVVYVQQYGNNNEVKEEHPRTMFLLSLLPDVQSFTDAEMRQFRREVIQVCDDIVSRRET